MNLQDVKTKLLNATKGTPCAVLGEKEDNQQWLISPAFDLNRILSGSLFNSVLTGNHTAIIGPEASGKSSFIALLVADAQKKGYLPVVFNAEGAWTPEFCSRWGIDPDNVIEIQTMWVDEIMVQLSQWIAAKVENIAIVIDSIGALDRYKMIDDGAGKFNEKTGNFTGGGQVKADQGQLQKEIKRMLKMSVALCKFQNCCLFTAGHYYGNPTGYGEPEKVGGGNYYRLSADTLISLKKSPIYQNPGAPASKRGKIIGTEVSATTLKNRMAPPFQEAKIEILYEKGVNKLAGIIDLAIDMGLVDKGGAWYTCDILNLKAQGEENLKKEMESIDIKPLLDQIELMLKDKGYSNVNETLKEMAEILHTPEPDVKDEDLETFEEGDSPKKETKKKVASRKGFSMTRK